MQNGNRGLVAVLLAAVLVVSLVSACAQTAAPPPTKTAGVSTPGTVAPTPTVAPQPAKPATQQLVPMRVAWTLAVAMAPLIVAVEKGYFKEQGIDLQLEIFKSAQDSMGFLAQGELQAVIGSINAGAMNMVNQGLPIKIVLPATYINKDYPALSLLVRKDLLDSGRVKGIKDLKGMKLAASGKGVNSEYYLEKALNTAGLTLDDVEMSYMSFPDMIVALSNKGLDAAQSLGPYDINAESTGIAKVLVRDVGLDFMNLVVFFGGKFIKEQPEIGKKFAVAWLKGTRDVEGKKFFNDDVINMVSKATSSPVADVRKSQLYYFDPNIPMARAADGLMEHQNLWLKRGYLNYKEPIDLRSMIDTTFADHALKELGQYKP